MILKHTVSALLIALLALTTSCETEMEVTIFATDMLDMDGDIEADALLFFEIPHDDWLSEDNNKANLEHFLTRHFGKLGEFSVKSIDFTTFCTIPFKTRVSSNSINSDMFGLSRRRVDAGIDLYCNINANKFKAFKSAVSDEFLSVIKLGDVKFRILVDNDSKDTVKVTAYSAYLGSKPAALQDSVLVERRKEITVRLSKIHMEAMGMKGESRLLSIARK
jgi:hypothetical protein